MKKKTQKLLSILLCCMLLIGLLPTTAFAAEEATVTTYDDLWRAFYSNDDYCITLGSDITYTIPEGGNTPLSPWQYLLNVDGTKNKTLDLNGHTLQVSNEQTSWPTQSGLFNIDDSASLTVMNGTVKLYNYNNSNRTDNGVFNARGGNLTLTNVDVLNGRYGTAVNAQGDAAVTIEGGTVSAFNGFAVTAVGTSWLTLDKNVVLTTTTGSGLITQPADAGYGSLHAATPNLTVVSAMFEAGIEVAESTIGQFSASANRLVFVGGNRYNSAFATSKSGDYYWDTKATGGCALIVNDSSYSFAKNVNVISASAKQTVTVTNGIASHKQAAYGTTVTITANEIPGKIFNGWDVESGGVTLADPSAKTTTFTMGAKAVEIEALYMNAPIPSAEFTVATPVQGGHPSAATTTTEHITVSETWCVERYDENSFSSTLPADHTFEGDHTYRTGVTFEVEQGYALDENFSVTFADPISSTRTPASQGATQYIWFVDYTVENNSVEVTSVTATVSGAEAGAAAGSTTVTTNDTTYTVSIKGWYDCDNVFSYGSAPVLQAADTFVGGKTYTVGVTFTPVGSNTLSNDLTVSINGIAGKIGGWDSGSRNYFITITVPAAQAAAYTVSFDANGGTGTMADVNHVSGDYTLPACGFTAPDGQRFKAWAIGSVNGEQKQPGEQITVTGETNIYAVWESESAEVKNGLYEENGAWVYYVDGVIAYDYTGLALFNGVWFYVSGGVVDFGYTGLTLFNGVWMYVSGGMVDFAYAGMTFFNGVWFYVSGGCVDWNYNGLTLYNGTWFYINGGMVDWNYEGMTFFNGTWFYVSGGSVNWDYVGMTLYNGYWFYIANGCVDWSYNSLTLYNGYWFYINGGMVDWNYTGLVFFNGVEFYVSGGMVDWSFTGAFGGKYVEGGMVVA